MSALMINRNLPLCHKKENILIFWQAKSGCTMLKKMFFHHEKTLDKIIKKTPWVHDFDYTLEYSIKNLEEYLRKNKSTKIIQFVRCPYERAVSSYIHVNRTWGVMKKFFPEENIKNCSFIKFLNILKITRPNIHYNKQITTYKNIDYIRIENLNDKSIEEFNKKYNLNYKIFTSGHYSNRSSVDNFFVGDKHMERNRTLYT